MGLPLYLGSDKRTDAFKFTDLSLSKKVRKGFHAVALDEQRGDFTPTLWDAASNVVQNLFPLDPARLRHQPESLSAWTAGAPIHRRAHGGKWWPSQENPPRHTARRTAPHSRESAVG